jgi:hypothetical protein
VKSPASAIAIGSGAAVGREGNRIQKPYLRHATGMLLVGLMIYALFQAFGHYYVEGVGTCDRFGCAQCWTLRLNRRQSVNSNEERRTLETACVARILTVNENSRDRRLLSPVELRTRQEATKIVER